jgi:hypothetical protein
MIKLLIFADAESSLLKNECNFRNQKPEDLDNDKLYSHLFSNIWDACSTRTQTSFERLQFLVKNYADLY